MVFLVSLLRPIAKASPFAQIKQNCLFMMVSLQDMADECSVDVLVLEHDPPEDFGVCVCGHDQDATTAYLCVRELIVNFNFAMVVWEIVVTFVEPKEKPYIFFDFWTQILLFVSSELGVYGPVHHAHESENDWDDQYWDYLPWYCKAYWALFSAALPSSMLSCIIFWSQVFTKDSNNLNIVINTVSPAVAVLEFFLIAFPLRLLHFVFFLAFYTIYVLFTVIYQKNGGTGAKDSVTIYPFLDWREQSKAVAFVFTGLAFGLAIYFFFCFVSMLKRALKHKYEDY